MCSSFFAGTDEHGATHKKKPVAPPLSSKNRTLCYYHSGLKHVAILVIKYVHIVCLMFFNVSAIACEYTLKEGFL